MAPGEYPWRVRGCLRTLRHALARAYCSFDSAPFRYDERRDGRPGMTAPSRLPYTIAITQDLVVVSPGRAVHQPSNEPGYNPRRIPYPNHLAIATISHGPPILLIRLRHRR